MFCRWREQQKASNQNCKREKAGEQTGHGFRSFVRFQVTLSKLFIINNNYSDISEMFLIFFFIHIKLNRQKL